MKPAVLSIWLCLFISFVYPSSLIAADVEQAPVVITQAESFAADELCGLEAAAKLAEERGVPDQVGGADEKFWKAAAIGAGAVLLIIIIF